MYHTYYRPSYARKAQAVKTAQPAVAYSVDTVWGAAAYAHRINDGYFKDGVWDVNQETGTQTRIKEPNRDLVKQALSNQSLISNEDRATGMQARDFLAQQLTMKTLKGAVSDFDRSLSGVVSREEFTDRDRLEIAITASQISAYERAKKDLATAERIDHTKGYLADVGAKVSTNVEITKVVYSQNYNVYFISGITDTNQAVFFSYRERQDVGTWLTIKGTVKAHRPDATQLSRVRVI